MPADVRKNKSRCALFLSGKCGWQTTLSLSLFFFFFLTIKTFSPWPYKSYKYRIASFILISSFHSHAICWQRAPLAGGVTDFTGAYFCTVVGNGVDVSRVLGEKSLKTFKSSRSTAQRINNFLVWIYILSIVQLLEPQKMLRFSFSPKYNADLCLYKFIHNAFNSLPW